MAQQKRMLTREEVAAELSISMGTLSTIMRQGRLHAVRFGHMYRIPRESLEAFIRGDEPERGLGRPDDETWPPTPSMLAAMDEHPSDAEAQARDDLEAHDHARRVAAHHAETGSPHPDDN